MVLKNGSSRPPKSGANATSAAKPSQYTGTLIAAAVPTASARSAAVRRRLPASHQLVEDAGSLVDGDQTRNRSTVIRHDDLAARADRGEVAAEVIL